MMAKEVYMDSSFVLSHLLNDEHTDEARTKIDGLAVSGKISELVLLEFHNMLRRKVGSDGFGSPHAERVIRELEEQIEAGWFEVVSGDWCRVWQRAMGLSSRYASELKVRSLDILHVAFAMESGHKMFWTFDKRQRALAEATGLCVD